MCYSLIESTELFSLYFVCQRLLDDGRAEVGLQVLTHWAITSDPEDDLNVFQINYSHCTYDYISQAEVFWYYRIALNYGPGIYFFLHPSH